MGGQLFDASLGCVAPAARLLVVGFADGRTPSVAIDDVLFNARLRARQTGFAAERDRIQRELRDVHQRFRGDPTIR